jgi:sodium ion-translocating decarboxylase beta subunit
VEIHKHEGERLEKGDVIYTLDSEAESTPVVGRIDSIKVSKGSHVKAGEVIATVITMEQTNQSEIPTRPTGLLSIIFQFGIMWQILPPLMFLCLGALGIIGGAEGPTTIYVTSILAPHIIGATAIACYSYMALVPLILPPVIKLLTSKKERSIYMKPQLRKVSKREKILFPLTATIIVILFVPSSAPLIGCFMVGNLFRESGVTERLSSTSQTAFVDMITIFLTLSIGATMSAEIFLQSRTLLILVLGVIAFATAAAAGIILAKIMNLFLKEKINPMIGAAGVSAVPMSARVVQIMGQKENSQNFLLMHAMGPNVAGAIGAAIAGGVFLGILG